MTLSPTWIAVDWGTSNLRVHAMDASGAVLDQNASNAGMSGLEPDQFEPALRACLNGWTLPNPCTVIACGMLGSRQGWQEAPYRSAPCSVAVDAPVRVINCSDDLEVWILPGIKQNAPADVMRGEETQIAGFIAQNPDWDGVICLPGTHSKWVHISAGEIVSFKTFMTGELFETISANTVLRHSLARTGKGTDKGKGKGTNWDDSAFHNALSSTLSRPERLAGALFSLRAADLLHGQSPASARAQLSGTLIGAELAAAKPYWLGQNIAIIGDDHLADLYSVALAAQGITAQRCIASEVTLAGLTSAYMSI